MNYSKAGGRLVSVLEPIGSRAEDFAYLYSATVYRSS